MLVCFFNSMIRAFGKRDFVTLGVVSSVENPHPSWVASPTLFVPSGCVTPCMGPSHGL